MAGDRSTRIILNDYRGFFEISRFGGFLEGPILVLFLRPGKEIAYPEI